jgi:hypothetical protein
LGLPRGRRLDSVPNRAAVRLIQRSSPYGRPRVMHSRSADSSADVCGLSTHDRHCRGRSTGQSASGSSPPALDQRQLTDRRTRPARNGLRSTYRRTVNRCSSCSIGNDLKRPCQRCPLPLCRRRKRRTWALVSQCIHRLRSPSRYGQTTRWK